jgi:hypothetical protein
MNAHCDAGRAGQNARRSIFARLAIDGINQDGACLRSRLWQTARAMGEKANR